MIKCVLLPWLFNYDYTVQAAALTGLRGYDAGMPDKVKHLVRWVRGILLKDGRPNNEQFVRSNPPEFLYKEFIGMIEYMSWHYVWHLAHSLEIIGYLHPDEKIADQALQFYDWICKKSHVTPETVDEMLERLADSNDPNKGVD